MRAQHAKAGAAADVGAEPHAHAAPARRREVEQAAAEEQVRGRAERHRGAGVPPCARGRSRRDGCNARTPRARAAARSGRRRRDSCGSRETARPPTPLRRRFSATCAAGTRRDTREQARRRARAGARSRSRKARRDRVGEPAAPVPLRDQRRLIAVAAIRRCRAGTPGSCGPSGPCRRPCAALRASARLEEDIDRMRVHGGEHQRRRRAVAQQLVEEEVGDFAACAGSSKRASAGKV